MDEKTCFFVWTPPLLTFNEKEVLQYKEKLSYSLGVLSPLRQFFSTVTPIFHKIWILMVYSHLVVINEGSAEVLVILVQDFYLINLSKTFGELGQQIWLNFFWPSSPSVLETFNKWKSKKRSWGPLLNLNWYIQVGFLLSIYF